VVVRAIDSRASLVLVEYTDIGRLDWIVFWIPVSNLLFPHKNIAAPASSSTLADLTATYEETGRYLNAIYARETLLQYMSAGVDLRVLTQSLKLTDIV
jgi:hypothetical protein